LIGSAEVFHGGHQFIDVTVLQCNKCHSANRSIDAFISETRFNKPITKQVVRPVVRPPHARPHILQVVTCTATHSGLVTLTFDVIAHAGDAGYRTKFEPRLPFQH